MSQPRQAVWQDILRLMEIRFSVQENRLSDPGSVTVADCERFVAQRRVWVTEVRGRIAGFSASDERDGTIWALFVDPAYQGAGLGMALLDCACADLAADGHTVARLSTDPGTRADRFYRRHGWMVLGLLEDGEMAFEKPLVRLQPQAEV